MSVLHFLTLKYTPNFEHLAQLICVEIALCTNNVLHFTCKCIYYKIKCTNIYIFLFKYLLHFKIKTMNNILLWSVHGSCYQLKCTLEKAFIRTDHQVPTLAEFKAQKMNGKLIIQAETLSSSDTCHFAASVDPS